MNWELLLYIAGGLALIAAGLFVAALGYAVLHAISVMRVTRATRLMEDVKVTNWPDPGDAKAKAYDQQRANRWTRR